MMNPCPDELAGAGLSIYGDMECLMLEHYGNRHGLCV